MYNLSLIACAPTQNLLLPLVQRDRGAVASHDARARREANSLNSDEMEFYIGLLLDGVPTYRNVSDTLPEYGKLDMFNDPKVFEFKDEVLLFRPYSPHNDQHVVIKVITSPINIGADCVNCNVGDEWLIVWLSYSRIEVIQSLLSNVQ